MRVLFCPAHYVYDGSREGSELAWAYNIADRVCSLLPTSVVVTGRSTVDPRPYRIVEVTPQETRVNFGLTHAFVFNAKYTRAAFRQLRESRFDVVHHILPFAIGKTYNLAALRHGRATPFVIGPVQPPLGRDLDVDPKDFKGYGPRGRNGLAMVKDSISRPLETFGSNVVAPIAFGSLSRRTMSRAAAVVAVNDETRELLLREGLSPSAVFVIPPGVDTKRFAPTPARASRAGGVVILSVCQLIKRKRVDVIIRAFATVADALPHVRLRIVGDGAEREALTTLAHTLGIEERIVFTGFVSHDAIHREYQQADIFVNTSEAESFGTTCMEALAVGLPVVSTRVGEFATAIKNHRTGYLLDGIDPGELAAALVPIVANQALIRDLSKQARRLAEDRFDWDTAIIPRYLDVYSRVIAAE